MAKAPELRHLIEFRFYAEAYDKWWTDEHTDFEAEQMRMVEEYSELNSLFSGFRRLLMTFQIQGQKRGRMSFRRWMPALMNYTLN